ncbi:MAG: acyl carrier protein [Reyranellaceae bacterium]
MDLAKIHDVIAAALRRELGGIDLTDDLELVESGIIDSLALTTIVAALETAYPGLRIPDSDATVDNLASVDRIKAYLSSAQQRA